MKKVFMLIAVLIAVVSITSCSHTAQGVSSDVDHAIDSVKDATN